MTGLYWDLGVVGSEGMLKTLEALEAEIDREFFDYKSYKNRLFH